MLISTSTYLQINYERSTFALKIILSFVCRITISLGPLYISLYAAEQIVVF